MTQRASEQGERNKLDVPGMVRPEGGLVTRRAAAKNRLVRPSRVSMTPRSDSERTGETLVTRREHFRRRRVRKRLLIALAFVLALFPPMWAVYLVAWLIWRSRPDQKSMRRVRQSVRFIEKDQPGPALRHLQEAHLLNPANTDALYWLGLVLSSQGRHEEAEEALSIVAGRVPGLPEVEAALVEAYVAMGQGDSAVFHAQRLLDVAPYETDSLLKLADAFELDGRPDLAVEALGQAPIHKRVLTEELLLVHYRLGVLHERLGDQARALHHLRRVYARDATFQDVRERLAALEQSGTADQY